MNTNNEIKPEHVVMARELYNKAATTLNEESTKEQFYDVANAMMRLSEMAGSESAKRIALKCQICCMVADMMIDKGVPFGLETAEVLEDLAKTIRKGDCTAW